MDCRKNWSFLKWLFLFLGLTLFEPVFAQSKQDSQLVVKPQIATHTLSESELEYMANGLKQNLQLVLNDSTFINEVVQLNPKLCHGKMFISETYCGLGLIFMDSIMNCSLNVIDDCEGSGIEFYNIIENKGKYEGKGRVWISSEISGNCIFSETIKFSFVIRNKRGKGKLKKLKMESFHSVGKLL